MWSGTDRLLTLNKETDERASAGQPGASKARRRQARKEAHFHRQEAGASGARVRILLRTRAHPAKVYEAARSAARSAAECLRIRVMHDLSTGRVPR
jgi:hypothetical protein